MYSTQKNVIIIRIQYAVNSLSVAFAYCTYQVQYCTVRKYLVQILNIEYTADLPTVQKLTTGIAE